MKTVSGTAFASNRVRRLFCLQGEKLRNYLLDSLIEISYTYFCNNYVIYYII